MARIFLFINAILFLGFGAYVFLATQGLINLLDVTDMGASGLYEIRSNYGGVSLGIGLMCLLGGLKSGLTRPALFTLMAYMGGYALGRIIALPLGDFPSMEVIGFGVFEGVTALISAILLRSKT